METQKQTINEITINNIIYVPKDSIQQPKEFTGDIKIVPGNIGDKKIFIQSTSVNRKLMAGTNVLIYNR